MKAHKIHIAYDRRLESNDWSRNCSQDAPCLLRGGARVFYAAPAGLVETEIGLLINRPGVLQEQPAFLPFAILSLALNLKGKEKKDIHL